MTALRANVLKAMAFLGRDPQLRTRAEEVAKRFIESPDTATSSQLIQFLPLAARSGDENMWLALRTSLDRKLEPMSRIAVITALGAFEDPGLFTRSLDLILKGTLRPSDFAILGRGIGTRTRDAAWMWMTRHYERLIAELRPRDRARLPWTGSGFCTEKDQERVTRFFEQPERITVELDYFEIAGSLP